MVIPLQKIIDGNVSESISQAISQFTCQDKDVEMFLKNKAFDFERRDKSRTYLIFNDDGGGGTLVGYFTISLNALPFRESVAKNSIKRIDGFSKDVKAVGIILIGQFGKDCNLAKNIKGKDLLEICLRTIKKAKNIVGGRFVMLECLDVQQVVSFYKTNGFQPLQFDENDKYLQMVRRLQ